MPLNQKFACGELVDNRYQLDIQIHSGRWGEIFRATDRRDDRPVAVRFFPGAANAEEFVLHGRRLASLRAPGLSTPIAFGAHQGVLYAIHRWAAGQTLEDYLAEQGPLNLGQTLQILGDLLEALAKAHDLNLSHGLLRPSKIVIGDLANERARVTIVDFQLWKFFELASGQQAFVEQNLSRRILRYSGPEILQNNAVMMVTDVYALGLLVVEMLTGQPALDENHRVALIAKLLDPTPLELGADVQVGPLFRNFLSQLLAKNPTDRVPNAGAVLALFNENRDDFLAELEPPSTPQDAVQAAPSTPKRELFGQAPSTIEPLAPPMVDEDYDELISQATDPDELFGEPLYLGEGQAPPRNDNAESRARPQRHAPNSSLIDGPSLEDIDPAIIEAIPQATEVQRFPSSETARALTPIGESIFGEAQSESAQEVDVQGNDQNVQDLAQQDPQPPSSPPPKTSPAEATADASLSINATLGLAICGLAIIIIGALFLLKPDAGPDAAELAAQEAALQQEQVTRHKIRINTSPPALRVQVQGRPSGMSPMTVEVTDDEFPLQIQARLNADTIVTHTLEGPQEEFLIEFDL